MSNGMKMLGALQLANPVTITSVSGVLTLTGDSNSFIAGGTEPITSIAGGTDVTQGIYTIIWNARTVNNSTNLLLIGRASRVTAAGDVGVYQFSGGVVTELSYMPVAGYTAAVDKISVPSGSAQGDVLIRDGSGWNRLAAGTAGQVLTTQGTGANPSWGIINIGSDFSNLYIYPSGNYVYITANSISLPGGILPCVATSVNLTVNAASAGANGLDTGTVGDGFYYVWVISNGSSTAGLLSRSSTDPVMPSGYSYKRRVGVLANNWGYGFYSSIQKGEDFRFTSFNGGRVLASGVAGSVSTPTWVSVFLSWVPPTAKIAELIVFNNYSGGALSNVLVAPNNGYGTATSTNPPPVSLSSGYGTSTPVSILMQSVPYVYWASQYAGGAIYVDGWKDSL